MKEEHHTRTLYSSRSALIYLISTFLLPRSLSIVASRDRYLWVVRLRRCSLQRVLWVLLFADSTWKFAIVHSNVWEVIHGGSLFRDCLFLSFPWLLQTHLLLCRQRFVGAGIAAAKTSLFEKIRKILLSECHSLAIYKLGKNSHNFHSPSPSFPSSFMKLASLAAVSLAVAGAVAKLQLGVFNGIKSITPSDNRRPEQPSWHATVLWEIKPAMGVQEGDTFTLHMPYVYKFTSSSNTLQLTAGGQVVANCNLYSGENIVGYSEVQCTATAAAANAGTFTGDVTFPFTFNAGSTSDEVNLEAAGVWKSGQNTVTWSDGDKTFSTTVDFNPGASSIIQGSPENGVYGLRKMVSLNINQHYLMGPLCPYDGQYGRLEISNPSPGVGFDCSSLAGAITDQVNDWYFPKTAEKIGVNIDSCSSYQATVSFSNLPAGFRPYININAAIPNVASFRSLNTYSYNFVCGGRRQLGQLLIAWVMYNNGNTGSGGDFKPVVVTTVTDPDITTTAVVTSTGTSTNTIVVSVPISVSTVTHTGTDSVATTHTTTKSGTRIISIDVPTPTTTITSTWTGSTTETITVPASSSGGTNTVVVEVPTPTTTVTRTWTGTVTSTEIIPAPSGGTATVIVDVPTPVTTVTRTWTGSVTSTETIPAKPGGTETVVIDVPTPSTTIYSTWTGTETTTRTIPASSPGGTDTVFFL